MTRLDHLVIAGTDLPGLVAWWTLSTGIAPSPGGAHQGYGTRNALVGVDDQTYIELIAPDPDQPEPDQPRPFGIDEMEPMSIRLAAYALAVEDLSAACDLVRAAGFDPGPIRSMSRALADGTALSWRLAIPPAGDLRGTQPFLIEWGTGPPRPAETLDASVSIADLSIAHPDAGRLGGLLESLGSTLLVEQRSEPGLAALIAAPGGPSVRI